MAKLARATHLISSKQFQKGPILSDLVFKKAKLQPWFACSRALRFVIIVLL